MKDGQYFDRKARTANRRYILLPRQCWNQRLWLASNFIVAWQWRAPKSATKTYHYPLAETSVQI